MKYYIWDRETKKLLAECREYQSAQDFRAIRAAQEGKPKSAYRISYE